MAESSHHHAQKLMAERRDHLEELQRQATSQHPPSAALQAAILHAQRDLDHAHGHAATQESELHATKAAIKGATFSGL